MTADATPDHAHYFDDDPTVPSRPSTVALALPDLQLELVTDRGVFAADGVDPGTKLLLLTAPPPAPGATVVDVGCGYGPIAVTLARREPTARVVAVDTNRRALALCAANAAAAGCKGVEVVHADDVPDDVVFDTLYSNPPIRIGKVALHDLLTTWLGRLRRGGAAWLVVQRHLGADSLATWLSEQGHHVRRVRSSAGYRILEVTTS